MTTEAKVQTVLKVPARVRQALKRMAEEDGRTMAGLFTHLVQKEEQRRAGNSGRRSAPRSARGSTRYVEPALGALADRRTA